MTISKANAKKLKYLFADGNEKDFIEVFMKIVNKDSKIVPFKLTREQKYLVENMEKLNIISKSRQLGISSVTIALSLRECIVYPNSNCLLVSYDQKSCNDIFNKLKQMYNLLPVWLKPKEICNNRQELKFTNGSRITCVTAGNKDLGRGATLNLIHLSEFAFMKNQKKQITSILQALSPTGKLIIESTSNGLNYYSDLATKAQNSENDFKLFFFNWINGGSLFKDKYKESVEKFKARNNNKMISEKDLDDEEIELKKLGASLEQIVWRRTQIGIIGKEKFKQEYPSTMLESFLTTGNSMFDSKKINTIETNIISNKSTYLNKNELNDLPSILKKLYGRSFFIWKKPIKDNKYSIGVDCSEGVGQDYTVVEVLDKDGEQVAEFYSNKIKPYQIADIVNDIGRYYNNALITIEKASGGHSVIQRLRYDLKYMNMTKYKSYDEFNKVRWQVGFDTNSKTKSLILNDFIELFEKGQIKINSRKLLQEMKIFEMKDNGSCGASGTGHDDTVMAMCFAIVSLKNKIHYKM